MYSIRFQTTSDARWPPPDLPINYTWDRLEDLLAGEIGPEASRLLAEPVADPGRAETHWHVTAERDPISLVELDRTARSQLLEKLAAIRAKVEARAVALEAKSGENTARQAAVLRLIVTTPDDDFIWSLDGEPLLTCWGRTQGGDKPEIRPIVGSASYLEQPGNRAGPANATKATGPSAPTSASSTPATPDTFFVIERTRRFRWLGALVPWLLFVVLVAIGYARLLAACGIWLPGGPALCIGDRVSDLRALRDRNEDLRRALRDRESRVASLRPCSPSGPDQAVPPDRNEIEKRRREQHVSKGRLDVTLAWNGHADLDLHILCPSGEISFSARTVCGGSLDHDANNGGATLEDRPVEHVTWTSDPPQGRYRVNVVLFDFRDGAPGPVPFTIVVRDGDSEKSYDGVLSAKGEQASPVTFDR